MVLVNLFFINTLVNVVVTDFIGRLGRSNNTKPITEGRLLKVLLG
jgi:hypothetical protein